MDPEPPALQGHDSILCFEDARDYLYGLKCRGRKYGIDRMILFSQALMHPERAYPSIHVAGTNGKGSTCAMLEAIYRRSGFRTGLFTSPHLVYQGERIQVNRQMIGKDDILRYTLELKKKAEEIAREDRDNHPSFFEFMTAMGFLHFKAQAIDIAIIETGLGGRLDATNVLEPEVSVITSIGLDHCGVLGETHPEIAREKAGIIKKGKPVVIGNMPREAEDAIRLVAEQKNAPVWSVREKFGEDLKNYPTVKLEGECQQMNAATASIVVEILRKAFPVSDGDLHSALGQVEWPGRWDRRSVDGRNLILDASHNFEGAVMLRHHLERLVAEKKEKPIIVTGTLGEDRGRVLFPVIAEFAREIILLRPSQWRASEFEEMERCLPASFKGRVSRGKIRELFPARNTCAVGKPGDTIVATGSIYLLGEIMEALFAEVPVNDHILQD